MFAWQFAQALAISDRRGSARFVSMQNHYNLIYREEEREMLPLCRSEGIGVIPWSPLARGLLAGSRRAGLQGDTARAESDDFARTLYTDSDLEVADRVVETARRRALAPARIALASSRAPASPRRSSAPAAWHTWTTRSRLSMSLSPKRSAVSSRSPTAPTKSAATSDRRSAIARDLGLWPTGERLGRMRP
jgi:hypothetical protein